jgi:hypothetical protein
MKKINTTYLDNLVSKILKETLEERADTLVSKIKGDMCEQCGGNMNEDICEQCGNNRGEMEEGIYDVDNTLDGEFDYVGESEEFVGDEENTDEDREKTCRYHIDNFGKDDPVTKEMCQGINITEALKGRQKKLDKNRNNKIDSEDFKLLRKDKKSKDGNSMKFTQRYGMEEQETEEGNAFSGALSKAKKDGKDSFEVDGKKYPVKESYRLTESEMVSMIEKIVLEQKNKKVKDPAEKNNIKGIGGSPRGLEVYKKAHNGSGKENDEYIKSVAKKMKDYLKDGSKGDYEMNPKIFPVGNGELEKMDKKAFQMTDDLEDFNYEIAGLNLPTPDAIEFNEDWMEKLYKGDSKTGNAPGGNALESKANDRFDKLRKKNTLKKLKDQSYNRVSQPVYNEKSGTDKGKGLNIKLESIEDKKTKQINEEFERMKSLIGYNQKTQ